MKIYLQNPEKTRIQVFETENQIGTGFIAWTTLTEQGIAAYELQEAINSKLAELEAFHDSLPARVFYAKTFKNTFTFSTLEKHRALLFEQISMCDSANKSGFPMNQIGYNHKEIKPNGELISEFISLANINWIYANLGNIVNKNYEIKLTHQTNIRKLRNIADVVKYDFKAGYLLNQTIILK